MTKLFRSFGFKLVLASLVAEIVLLGALLFSDTRVVTQALAGQTATRITELKNLLNASLAAPLVERDNGALQDILNAIRSPQGIEFLVLEDAAGRTMARSGWPENRPVPPMSTRSPDETPDRWDTAMPVTLGGQTYGHLYFGISTTPFVTARRTMVDRAIAIFAFSVAASTALFSMIAFWLTRRLRVVTRTTEAFAVADHSARVATNGSADEVARLGHSFNLMADRLENQMRDLKDREEKLRRSNADLQQFAYLASHDLQTPLRTVVNYMQMVEQRYADKLDAEGREFIDIAVAAAKRMVVLVRDILAFSRVDTRGKDMVPVALEAVWNRVVEDLRIPIEETAAQVSHAAPLPRVLGDDIQIGQVLANLIGNALKYRHPDRPPVVRVDAKRQGDFWVLSVADNGIGIESQYFDRIFLIFQRLHTEEEFPGTGIGLALCKKIVERHGGRIWLDSVPGEGSTFFVALSAADA